MNGHDRRRQRISDRIKRSALELFITRGVSDVSMDEIAAAADVSKVTIYKYFGSKADLQQEVLHLYVDEVLAATEAIIHRDVDFLEKLKQIMAAQLTAARIADSRSFFALLETNGQTDDAVVDQLPGRITEIMYQFYEQGIREGYIDKGVSFTMLTLYAEIFQTGFRAKAQAYPEIFNDAVVFESLIRLYFFGVIRDQTASR